MQVNKVKANKLVKADNDRIALEYGPIVYCFEEVDNNTKVDQLVLDANAKYISDFQSNILGVVNVITTEGTEIQDKANRNKHQKIKLIAIPYYAWNNRGVGSMAVWMPYQSKPKQ